MFTEILKLSTELALIFGAIFLLFQWLFVYTAVKSASKKAIIEAYQEIENLKKNPPKTEAEKLKEELDGWN